MTRNEHRKPSRSEPDAPCVGFDVYLEREGQDRIRLEGVEKVYLPIVHASDGFGVPTLKLKFKSMDYADEVLKAYKQKCVVEVRVAVERFNPKEERHDVYGFAYRLNATPAGIRTRPLAVCSDTGAEVWLNVSSYAAVDGNGEELWRTDFERKGV